jgi:hypothetical protein
VQARAKLAAQEAKMRVFKDQHMGELPTQTQSNLQILTGLQSQMQANQDSLNRAKAAEHLSGIADQSIPFDGPRRRKRRAREAPGLTEIDRNSAN